MGHCDWIARIDDRACSAEFEELDVNELSLLGRADQLCGQPPWIRISRNDGLLRLQTASLPVRYGACDRAGRRPDPLSSPGMTFSLSSFKGSCDVSIHGTRHLPVDPVLLLHQRAGVEGTRCL